MDADIMFDQTNNNEGGMEVESTEKVTNRDEMNLSNRQSDQSPRKHFHRSEINLRLQFILIFFFSLLLFIVFICQEC